jgi:hypothetical protein
MVANDVSGGLGLGDEHSIATDIAIIDIFKFQSASGIVLNARQTPNWVILECADKVASKKHTVTVGMAIDNY